MRINGIAARGFMGLDKDFTLSLSEKVSVFVGPNGAGKTSLINAVRVLIAGTIPGLLKKDSKLLASGDSERRKPWEIIGEIQKSDDDLKTILRTPTTLYETEADLETGEETRLGLKETVLREWIGVRPDVLDAVLDVWHVLRRMDPKERITLALRLSGNDIEAGSLREEGLDDEDVLEAALAGDWKKAHKVANDKKLEKRRAAESMVTQAPDDPDLPIPKDPKKASEVTNEEIKKFRAFRDGAAGKIRDNERQLGRAEKKVDVSSLEERKAKIEATLKEIGPKALAELIKQQKEKLEDLRKQNSTLTSQLEGLQEKARESLLETKAIRKEIKAAEEQQEEHPCPTCGLVHEGRVSEEHIQGLRTRLAEAEEKEILAVKTADDVATESGEVGNELSKVLTDIPSAERKIERARELQADHKEISSLIGSMTAVEEEIDADAIRRENQKLERQREQVEGVLSQIDEYRDALAAHSESKDLAKGLLEEADHYESMASLCLPTGLPTKLVQPALKAVRASIKKWKKLLPFDVELTDGFELNPQGRPLLMVSQSEEYRMALMLAASMSQLSGLRFMAIDEAASLDYMNRIIFGRTLTKEIAKDFDQILVAMPANRPKKEMGAPPVSSGTCFYWMEDGGIERMSK